MLNLGVKVWTKVFGILRHLPYIEVVTHLFVTIGRTCKILLLLLTFTMLWANSADNKLVIFSYLTSNIITFFGICCYCKHHCLDHADDVLLFIAAMATTADAIIAHVHYLLAAERKENHDSSEFIQHAL